jgi:hypothetical protein
MFFLYPGPAQVHRPGICEGGADGVGSQGPCMVGGGKNFMEIF